MDATNQTIQVAGKGMAELPIPLWLRGVHLACLAATFGLVLAGAFAASGWSWVTDAGADGFSPVFALWCAFVMTAAVAAPIAASRARIYDRLLNIRTVRGRRVFGGWRGPAGPLGALAATLALCAAVAGLAYQSARTCPLPEVVAKVRVEAPAPVSSEGLIPVYLWDYATFIDPAWLDTINIVVPYEKGPPAKLLPKVFFEDAQSHRVVLELHGKRPRQYSPTDVYGIFDSALVRPADWPLVWRLEREAGLTTAAYSAPILYLLRIGQSTSSLVTQAIGVPWSSHATEAALAAQPGAVASPGQAGGHFFYWGPDGSVFQVKCPSPCAMGRMLELVQFPPDPKGSRAQRLDWTKATLKRLLAAENSAGVTGASHIREQNLLSLYLVSLLTLDPRDPEAYFHLGMLARNVTTVKSAIYFGRDVGLEHEKLLELQSAADRLSP